ncbi:hypothetical protein [Caldalkalibacillus mannanilyticus]|uniref:hypothetical protein n=1 Tax=Caldalkalibacillus mannanilyticus TaxID=1418 RepID=UPI00046864A5|nr:hypothetical protein [Caldalkalibacillus mannanilyticus]
MKRVTLYCIVFISLVVWGSTGSVFAAESTEAEESVDANEIYPDVSVNHWVYEDLLSFIDAGVVVRTSINTSNRIGRYGEEILFVIY